MPLIGSLRPFRNRLAYPTGVAPGFDPTHPASNGCFASVVCMTPTAAQTNILTGKASTSGVASPSGLHSVIGPYINFSAGGHCDFACGASLTTATFAAIFIIPSGVSGTQSIAGMNNSGWGMFYDTTTGKLSLSSPAVAANLLPITIGIPYFAATTGRIGTAGSETWYAVTTNLLTGQITSIATGVTANIGAIADTLFRVDFVSGEGNGTFHINAAAMGSSQFTRLSPLLAWAADPWVFWYPRTPIDWVGKIAAAATVFPFVRRNIIRASAKGFR